MPIVIDYNPVGALGSLAMAAGQQQGVAKNYQDYLSHQRQLDVLGAQLNQQNRELDFAAQTRPTASLPSAGPRTLPQIDPYQKWVREQGMKDRERQAEIGAAAQETAATTTAREEAQALAERAQQQAEQQRFLDARIQQGISAEQAQQEYADFVARQFLPDPKDAPKPEKLPSTVGETARTAQLLAMAGDFSTIEGRIANSFEPQELIPQVRAGQLAAVQRMSAEQIERILQSGQAIPPEIENAMRAKVAVEKSVPANVRTPGGNVRDATDEQLLNMFQ